MAIRMLRSFILAQTLLAAASEDAFDAAMTEEQVLTDESESSQKCNVALLQEGMAKLKEIAPEHQASALAGEAARPVAPALVATSTASRPPPSDPSPSQEAFSSVKFSAFVAEFIAMALFVVIGCGSAMGIAKQEGSAWILQVSLTFGLAITSLAYAIGHYSGGQINCAVTLGLVIAGQLNIVQGILNFIAQMLGSLAGAWILTQIYPVDKDLTGSMASNSVSPNFSWTSAIVAEVLMTFLLVYVVLETAKNPLSAGNRELACVAIGFAVFLAHSVLIPIDGCSINPTRSFGPEIMARIRYGKGSPDHAVFWVGPLLGAAIAAGVYSAMSL